MALNPFNMRLHSGFLALARDSRHNNKYLKRYTTPQDVFDRYIPYFEDELGLELKEKDSNFLRLSKMTTTYFNEIRLGANWSEYSDYQKANIYVHEAVHARQWRTVGRFRFGTWYLRRPRWRWAIEMQGYRESVRWAVIELDAKKAPTRAIEAEVRRRSESVTGILLNGYSLARVSKYDRAKYTKQIIIEDGMRQLRQLR